MLCEILLAMVLPYSVVQYEWMCIRVFSWVRVALRKSRKTVRKLDKLIKNTPGATVRASAWWVVNINHWSQWRACNVTLFEHQALNCDFYYSDVIMRAMTYQITGVSIVYSTACSGAGQRKNQSSASLAFVRGIHRLPVNSPHKVQ